MLLSVSLSDDGLSQAKLPFGCLISRASPRSHRDSGSLSVLAESWSRKGVLTSLLVPNKLMAENQKPERTEMCMCGYSNNKSI